MIGEVSLFNILLPVLVAVTVASRGFRVDEDYMASWANHFGLRLTNERGPSVRRYLQWTRRLRTAGGLAGFLAPTLYYEVVADGHQPDDVGGWAITLMFVGYLLGAILAEVVIDPPRRRSHNPVAGARLHHHLPMYALVLQRGLGIASLLLVGLYSLSEPTTRNFALPDVAHVIGLGFAATCAAVTVEVLQRRILARPPLATTESDAAAVEAMRASSVLVLAGGVIALLMGIAGPMLILSVIAYTAEFSLAAFLALGTLGLVLLTSLYFWLYFGKPGGFGLRGSERQPARA